MDAITTIALLQAAGNVFLAVLLWRKKPQCQLARQQWADQERQLLATIRRLKNELVASKKNEQSLRQVSRQGASHGTPEK